MSSYTNDFVRMKHVMLISLGVSLLFFFFNLIQFSAFFYVGILGLLVSIFILTEKELFLMISFLIPNLFMFKQLGSQSAILGYFFMLISVKSLMKKLKGKIKVNPVFIVHIIFTLITSITYSDSSLLISLIRFAFNFSLFSYCATMFYYDGEIKQVVKTYFAGIIVAILMGIIFYSSRGALYGGLFAGVNSGRNYFGAVVTPTITIVLLYFLEKKVSFSETILYGTTVMLCMISIVLSNSRTSVLSLSIPVLMCFICLMRSVWKFNKKLLPLIILLSVFVVIVYMNYHDSVLSLLDRFSDDDVKTGNRRFELWQYYIVETLKTPLTFFFGSGSKSQNKLVEHNTFIQCFYELGVIGFITMFGIIHKAFRNIIKGNKIRILSLFPLLSVIFPYCGINGLYADQFSYLLVLCAMIIKGFSKSEVLTNANVSSSATTT